MSEHVWVGIIIIATWASLPVSLIIANAVFDNDVVRPGESAGGHH